MTNSARSPSAPARPEPPHPQVRQRDLQFIPSLTVVVQGTTVDFPNEDKVFHNVFSFSEAARFDLGLYKSGTSRSVTFRLNPKARFHNGDAVLARDVDYANVLPRVERLRAARGLSAPAAGETIAGAAIAGVSGGARYRLVRELGRGATGVVYLARDAELERDVAVKLLHPHLAAAPQADAVKRFFHEARVMASLRHPNLVAVLDLEERARRIVLELAAGGTLRDTLRERGPRTLRRSIERHSQILSALSAAHRRGIVHRDLKPANVIVCGDAPTIVDFGIAKHLGDRAVATTARRIGTPPYMAPEQFTGGVITPAVDVFALGVMLFELVTGELPFASDNIVALLHEVSRGVQTPPPPTCWTCRRRSTPSSCARCRPTPRTATPTSRS